MWIFEYYIRLDWFSTIFDIIINYLINIIIQLKNIHIGKGSGRRSGRVRLFVGNRGSGQRFGGSGLRKVTRGQLCVCVSPCSCRLHWGIKYVFIWISYHEFRSSFTHTTNNMSLFKYRFMNFIPALHTHNQQYVSIWISFYELRSSFTHTTNNMSLFEYRFMNLVPNFQLCTHNQQYVFIWISFYEFRSSFTHTTSNTRRFPNWRNCARTSAVAAPDLHRDQGVARSKNNWTRADEMAEPHTIRGSGERVVSSLSGVWGGALAANAF